MKEIQKVRFSCPKCNIKLAVVIDKFHSTIKCRCGYSFLIMASNNIEFFVELEPDTELSTKGNPPITNPCPKPEQELIFPAATYAQPGEVPPIEKGRKKSKAFHPKRKTTYQEYEPIRDSHFRTYHNVNSVDSGSFGNILLTTLLLIYLFALLNFSIVSRSEGKEKAMAFTVISVLIAIGHFFIPLLIAYLADEKTGHAWLWFFVSIFLVPIDLAMFLDVFPFFWPLIAGILALQMPNRKEAFRLLAYSLKCLIQKAWQIKKRQSG